MPRLDTSTAASRSGYVGDTAESVDGLPLMRPMPLAFPGDRQARDAELQYLFGPDVLVAPLLEPGGRRTFYVPPGEWLGLVGGSRLTGPGWREVTCAPDEFPAFVRAEYGPEAVLGAPREAP